jgi:hypothetical protein
VRVKARPMVEILGTLYPAFLATLMGAMPLAAHGHGLASALIAAGSFPAGTLAFLGWSKRSNRAAKRLADKVEGIVAAEVARQGSTAAAVSDDERQRRLAARKQQLE